MGSRIRLCPPTTRGLAKQVYKALLQRLDLSVEREKVGITISTASADTMCRLASLADGTFKLKGALQAGWDDRLVVDSKTLKSASLYLIGNAVDLSLSFGINCFGTHRITLRQWSGGYCLQNGIVLEGTHVLPENRKQRLPGGAEVLSLSPELDISEINDLADRTALLSEVIAALPAGLSASGTLSGSFGFLDRLEQEKRITVERDGMARGFQGTLLVKTEEQLEMLLDLIESDPEASGFVDVETQVKEEGARFPSEINIEWGKSIGRPGELELNSIDSIPKEWREQVKKEARMLAFSMQARS